MRPRGIYGWRAPIGLNRPRVITIRWASGEPPITARGRFRHGAAGRAGNGTSLHVSMAAAQTCIESSVGALVDVPRN
jgi:hypothetical protein